MSKKPKAGGGGLSATEIARLSGLSTSRVYTLLAEGRSCFEILLSAERRKQQAAAREVPVLPIDVDVVAPLVNGGTSVNGVPSYSASLAKKESMLAELRNVELMQKRGELMPVSYFRHWGMKFLVEAQDLWLQGPSELADRLASESDPLQCEAIVRGFVERVVDRLYKLERLWSPPPPEAA
jgi:hypothetical protein